MQSSNIAPDLDIAPVTNFAPPETPLAQWVERAATKADQEKVSDLVNRFHTGKLKRKELAAFSPKFRHRYVKKFGYPKTASELRAIEKTTAKNKKRNKIARKSRAKNR